MRYRKNIDCLTAGELHDLREALQGMYDLPASDPSSFAMLASFHGGPPVAYCAHGSPGFFTWHRAYLMAFESALRTIRCDVTLPFWDWSSGPSTGVPEACRDATYVNRDGDTVTNPLYSGPDAGGGQTSRRADIDTTTFDDLATSAQAAMAAADFASFQGQINGVHGGVHVRVGGDMGFVPTAGYDPIFYLHHANVDRLWAQWQSAHPSVSLPAAEAAFQLQPFARPYSVQWQTGSDVESISAMGYRYRYFCFYLPPIILWRAVPFELPPLVRQRLTSARLAVKSHHMQARPLELRAFVDQPDANARTRTTGNPGFAGAAGFMGHAPPGQQLVSAHDCPQCRELGHTRLHAHHIEHGHGSATVARQVEERFDIELDITAGLAAMPSGQAAGTLKLIAVDADGNDLPAEDVLVESVELVID